MKPCADKKVIEHVLPIREPWNHMKSIPKESKASELEKRVYTAKQEVGYRQCCSSSHDFLPWFSRHSFIAHAYNT